MINIIFSDSTQTVITGYLASPPPTPSDFPNYGTVEANDPRYKTFYAWLLENLIPVDGMPLPE